jgi:hypothetical protein
MVLAASERQEIIMVSFSGVIDGALAARTTQTCTTVCFAGVLAWATEPGKRFFHPLHRPAARPLMTRPPY